MRLREGSTPEWSGRITGPEKGPIGPFLGLIQAPKTHHSNPNFFNR
jgi:hypothetical protein